MFTLDQIKEAHEKVKTGADFPSYIKELIKLGVSRYDTYVIDGHTLYFSMDGDRLESAAIYPGLQIAEKSNLEWFQERLRAHQAGQTDYLTFCQDAAKAGVQKWTTNTQEKTCVYFDQAGTSILVETIPS